MLGGSISLKIFVWFFIDIDFLPRREGHECDFYTSLLGSSCSLQISNDAQFKISLEKKKKNP